MFNICRPEVRHCEQGHGIVLGASECEEGHQPVQQRDDDCGLLRQIFSAVR